MKIAPLNIDTDRAQYAHRCQGGPRYVGLKIASRKDWQRQGVGCARHYNTLALSLENLPMCIPIRCKAGNVIYAVMFTVHSQMKSHCARDIEKVFECIGNKQHYSQ